MTLYWYRVKRLFRNKTLFFWSIIFPVILATFFKVAFSSITEKDWGFSTIKVAVTAENGAAPDEMLVSFLEEMETGDTPFFEVTICEKAEAEKMLSEKDVQALIVAGDEVEVQFYENGLNSTIVKTVLDGYVQSKDILMTAAMNGTLDAVVAVLSDEAEVLAVKEFPGASKDPMIQYFQALIAMASLYGAMYGLMNTSEMNPLARDVAARRLAAPIKKVKTVLTDVAAAFTIQYVQFLMLIGYCTLLLRLDFGEVNGLLFAGGAAFSLFGVLIGYFIGTVIRKKESVQDAIMMGCVMGSCFLAGLMVGNMRIMFEQSAPIVNRINPATLIADALQALCVMGDKKRFALCLLRIGIWCAVLIAGSVIAILWNQKKDGRRVEK